MSILAKISKAAELREQYEELLSLRMNAFSVFYDGECSTIEDIVARKDCWHKLLEWRGGKAVDNLVFPRESIDSLFSQLEHNEISIGEFRKRLERVKSRINSFTNRLNARYTKLQKEVDSSGNALAKEIRQTLINKLSQA